MRLLLLACLMLLATPSAWAGQLFPPEDLTEVNRPNDSCPDGRVLGWTGQAVRCINPTDGVTTNKCPAGQFPTGVTGGRVVCSATLTGITFSCGENHMLTGFDNGHPICAAVPASNNGNGNSSFRCPPGQIISGFHNNSPLCTAQAASTSNVSCPAGQVLTGITNGTPVCKNTVPTNCVWTSIPVGSMIMTCGQGKYITGLAYEGATWTTANDNHSGPEIYSAYCCDVKPE